MDEAWRSFVTVVSGLPRSGTSLLMQMLRSGGLPVLADDGRAPDEDNPRGYLEYEPVKALRADASFVPRAVGRAVKVVHALLDALPAGLDYRVVFMERDLDEVLRSQRRMLERGGRAGARIPDERLRAVFAQQVARALERLAADGRTAVLRVPYADLVRDPRPWAARVADFLGGGLDVGAMAAAVDPRLYRQRSTPAT